MPISRDDTASRLDRVIAEARRQRDLREQSYRERALKLYPWVCGRCTREFTRANVQQLTVHHRDGNHDNNPPDAATGSCCASTATRTSTRGCSMAPVGPAAAAASRASRRPTSRSPGWPAC